MFGPVLDEKLRSSTPVVLTQSVAVVAYESTIVWINDLEWYIWSLCPDLSCHEWMFILSPSIKTSVMRLLKSWPVPVSHCVPH